MAHLVRELGALYTAFNQRQADPLAPLPIQYPDYAAWQREWLVGERQRLQAEYWRNTLADVPSLLALPTDRPRPPRQTSAGRTHPVALNAVLTRRLKQLAQQEGVTLFMVLTAAWSAVLAKLSGQDDLVIGTVTANRNRAEIETLIGFFVNAMALRIDLSGDPNVHELLVRVRDVALRAQDHQDLPFEQVVDIAQVPRRTDCSPLCQVMFAWQSYEESELVLHQLTVSSIEVPFEQVRFDLELSLREIGDEIVGSFIYATALFDADTIERHCSYLERMLQAMVADTSKVIGHIELVDGAERQLLLETWNRTDAPYPRDRCVHEVFEQQVQRTPDAIAVVEHTNTLSYAQLNAQANQLAHQLIAMGVQPGDRVALLLERSTWLVIAEVAVLKAGAIYVPIDTQAPASRQAWLIENCQARVLVVADNTDTPDGAAVPALALATLAADTLPDTNPALALSAEAAAYVMYTSGSTGMPKGVLTPHRAIQRLLFANGYADFEASDCLAFAANPAFDACTMEVWGALLHGGRIAVLDSATVLDATQLADALARHAVTAMFLTTALFNLYAQAIPKALASLKYLLCGGERNDPASFWRVLAEGGPAHLIHCYGPTETTTYALTCPISSAWQAHDNLPIGRPIGNTRAYLLDAQRQPVPRGAVGELYIGGDGVALGYLNRPELEVERFLPDPFVTQPGARMYRTGDLARYLPDGNLVFVGRVDHQVKLRGYRIEPGEIEARLVAHPQVRDAAVLVRQDDAGEKRLVAYVVTEDEGFHDLAAALRAHLATQLPEYMVPTAYVRLGAFPLTASGKLDRKALPEPDDAAFALHTYVPPQGQIEVRLAALWQDMLGVARVGRHDHFFELGGHSLIAVRLLSRVAQAFGVDVPLALLFNHGTLEAFATEVQRAMAPARPRIDAPILPIARDGALPLSFAQQRLWFLAQLEGVSATYHIPFGLRLRGSLDVIALRHSLDHVFARHESLRTVFDTANGMPQVRLLPTTHRLPWQDHDLRADGHAGEAAARLIDEEAQAPFDLATGPLLRARLLQLAEDDHILLLTQHHIVSDGWSLGVLLRELGALYSAFTRGQASPLPPLNIQYADYAAWQRSWLSGQRLREQADYWRDVLADAPVLLTLPTDRPRPPQQSFAGAVLPIRLDQALTQELKRLGRQHGCTLFMTVLAAWSIVLARLSGQPDVVVGTPAANRGRSDIEPMIGFFVNTLALRIRLSAASTVADLLAHVQRIVLEAQANQDLPFEQVVEIAKPPRRLEHSPLFQVLFAWQNHDDLLATLSDVSVEPLPLPVHTVNFDLELNLGERDGGLDGGISYATSLFDQTTVARYADYLVQVLRAMAGDAAQPLPRLRMLGDAERQHLLETLNRTEAEYPRDNGIHQLFEQQAAERPEAIALQFGTQRWSYAELNSRANQLAHHFIERGVHPGTRVGVCLERSHELVVALLAVLKAGGAYVPLDPAYPKQRLAHILDDAAPVLVVCDGTGRHALRDTSPGLSQLVDLTEWPAHGISGEDGNPDPQALGFDASNPAYVIYTSGTTGMPKGVVVEHRNVVNFLHAMARDPGLAAGDRLLAVTSVSFDIAGLEIYLPLSQGARLVLASREEVADPLRLRRLLREQD
ncbi:MAG TPA: amino acid adenylation domain-containing protein, partial [Dyella sp.]|uniref:non-ribosomal peptide synthetase n=1 Tax=Dyella sp. TaxID=1869338 RepID=UPI002B9CDAEF